MANLKIPIFSKNKYSILEMIILILRTNPGTKLTPVEVDKLFNHPQVAGHLNRKNAKDPINSIVWCYEKYHNNEGRFPELGFNGSYFYMVENGNVSNRKNTSEYIEETSVYNNINNYSNGMSKKNISNDSELPREFYFLGVTSIAFLISLLGLIFNWFGSRLICFIIMVISITIIGLFVKNK